MVDAPPSPAILEEGKQWGEAVIRTPPTGRPPDAPHLVSKYFPNIVNTALDLWRNYPHATVADKLATFRGTYPQSEAMLAEQQARWHQAELVYKANEILQQMQRNPDYIPIISPEGELARSYPELALAITVRKQEIAERQRQEQLRQEQIAIETARQKELARQAKVAAEQAAAIKVETQPLIQREPAKVGEVAVELTPKKIVTTESVFNIETQAMETITGIKELSLAKPLEEFDISVSKIALAEAGYKTEIIGEKLIAKAPIISTVKQDKDILTFQTAFPKVPGPITKEKLFAESIMPEPTTLSMALGRSLKKVSIVPFVAYAEPKLKEAAAEWLVPKTGPSFVRVMRTETGEIVAGVSKAPQIVKLPETIRDPLKQIVRGAITAAEIGAFPTVSAAMTTIQVAVPVLKSPKAETVLFMGGAIAKEIKESPVEFATTALLAPQFYKFFHPAPIPTFVVDKRELKILDTQTKVKAGELTKTIKFESKIKSGTIFDKGPDYLVRGKEKGIITQTISAKAPHKTKIEFQTLTTDIELKKIKPGDTALTKRVGPLLVTEKFKTATKRVGPLDVTKVFKPEIPGFKPTDDVLHAKGGGAVYKADLSRGLVTFKQRQVADIWTKTHTYTKEMLKKGVKKPPIPELSGAALVTTETKAAGLIFPDISKVDLSLKVLGKPSEVKITKTVFTKAKPVGYLGIIAGPAQVPSATQLGGVKITPVGDQAMMQVTKLLRPIPSGLQKVAARSVQQHALSLKGWAHLPPLIAKTRTQKFTPAYVKTTTMRLPKAKLAIPSLRATQLKLKPLKPGPVSLAPVKIPKPKPPKPLLMPVKPYDTLQISKGAQFISPLGRVTVRESLVAPPKTAITPRIKTVLKPKLTPIDRVAQKELQKIMPKVKPSSIQMPFKETIQQPVLKPISKVIPQIKQRQQPIISQRPTQGIFIKQTQKQVQKQIQKTIQKPVQTLTPTITLSPMPSLKPTPWDWPLRGPRARIQRRRPVFKFPKLRTKYAPSLVGMIFRKPIARAPKIITGLEIRPLLRRKRKKRKRKKRRRKR